MSVRKFHAFFEYIQNGDKTLCRVQQDIGDLEHELLVRSAELFDLLSQATPYLPESELKTNCQNLLDEIKSYL